MTYESDSERGGESRKEHRNTFGGTEDIANNLLFDPLDTITTVEEEPWFTSQSSQDSGSGCSSSISSSSSNSVWPRWPRPILDDESSLSSRRANQRYVPVVERKWFFRTFQMCTIAICMFGLYTLVSSVVSLLRTTSQPELLLSANVTSLDFRDKLRAWIFQEPSEKYYSFPEVLLEEAVLSAPSKPSIKAGILDIQNFHYTINNESTCSVTRSLRNSTEEDDLSAEPPLAVERGYGTSLSKGEGVYFMIIVHSAPDHFAERQAIRSTWGSVKVLKNWGIRLVFLLGAEKESQEPESTSVVGRSIRRESSIFGDIVAGNFLDTYRNLTYKHLMGYNWVLNFCPGATFVLKTDDDAFIDIFQLFEFTSQTYGFAPKDTLLCNVFPEGTKPLRHGADDPKSLQEPSVYSASTDGGKKWVVTQEEYPHEIYPKYCGGLAYLITPDLLQRIFRVSHNSRFFWIDDVYVTGILRELVDREPFYMNLRYSYEAEEYRKWLSDRKPRKIPFMVVHVERGNKFTIEMNHLWRKTMRVWS